eukprot:TRINITY_DN5608_c5_g1_i1.p2 TRINITY_DN5608_c5_g1~~TRINITY_DN5608_c5_g1_i1.p2  ORF type:complete len:197 (+),score=100.11 TRINITY_DN5608_c5_g1_i1:68-592(+)
MAVDDKWIEQVFDLYDEDGSGAIDLDELSKAMHSVGLEIPRDELAEMMKKIDADGNQTIEKAEFKHMVKKKLAQKDSPEEAENAYNEFGRKKGGWDASGGLDADVLRAVHKELGLPVDEEKIQEFIAAAGSGGTISLADWNKVMQEATDIERKLAAEAAAAGQRAQAQPVVDEF